MLADNCKASIAFEHKQDAEQILSTLRSQDSIVFACIYDKHGLVFAKYRCGGMTEKIRPPLPRKDSRAFENGYLSVFKQIVLDNEIIGTIYLRDDMRYLYSELKWDIAFAVVLLLLGLVMSYFLSSMFQEMISRPILNLAYVAQKVSKKNDYSVRAIEESDDEVGYLTQVFNRMLGQIQQRDSALVEAKGQLEIKVRERTADLTTTNKHLTKEIAERVKAEEQVRQQNKFLNTVLESLTHPFYVIDANDYTIKIANSALYPGKLPEKTTCYLLTHKQDKPCNGSDDPCPLEEIKKTKRPVVIEHVHYDKDGNTRNVEVHAYPILDDEGNVSEIIEYTLDITERKQAEAELKAAQAKLIDTARQAGMAEVATGVLHNVGNVLNSVGVTTASIQKRIRNSKVSYLTEVVGLLEEHAEDLGTFMTTEEQGRKLPAFLANLSQELITEQERYLEALETLTKHVEHMAEIIQLQQSYSKTTSMVESASVAELVEDAIRINAEALTRHGVEVKREFADLPPVLLDHHKVLQILTNLISNAKYALSDSNQDDRILTICVTEPQGGHFRIEVHDNGIGITEENLTRIFEHGFTTKKHGYGFGLHSAALTAKEMNGSLTAYSDGHGKGTVFTLELPFQTQEISK
jgi:nitrogen fixation/metabolism regulation signal transduction histidine kinase